jgi:hypothetical protein
VWVFNKRSPSEIYRKIYLMLEEILLIESIKNIPHLNSFLSVDPSKIFFFFLLLKSATQSQLPHFEKKKKIFTVF